jgi:hypothetical protein
MELPARYQYAAQSCTPLYAVIPPPLPPPSPPAPPGARTASGRRSPASARSGSPPPDTGARSGWPAEEEINLNFVSLQRSFVSLQRSFVSGRRDAQGQLGPLLVLQAARAMTMALRGRRSSGGLPLAVASCLRGDYEALVVEVQHEALEALVLLADEL